MKAQVTTIATLLVGQTLLVAARRVEGGKIQLEFAEKIKNPSQSTNILAVFNEGDERFDQNNKGPRRCFMTIMPANLEKLFGVKADTVPADGSNLELNILNPSLGGKRLQIQITESHVPFSEYEAANPEKTAKQYTNREGEKMYFVEGGKLIWSKTTLVDSEPNHKIFKSDAQMSYADFVAAQVTEAIDSDILNATK